MEWRIRIYLLQPLQLVCHWNPSPLNNVPFFRFIFSNELHITIPGKSGYSLFSFNNSHLGESNISDCKWNTGNNKSQPSDGFFWKLYFPCDPIITGKLRNADSWTITENQHSRPYRIFKTWSSKNPFPSSSQWAGPNLSG